MKTTIRIRLLRDRDEFLGHVKGERHLGTSIREVTLDFDDPRVEMIFTVKKQRSSEFIVSWFELRREYSEQEIDAADWFHVCPLRVYVEPIADADSQTTLWALAREELGQPEAVPLIKSRLPRWDLYVFSNGPWLASLALTSALVKGGVSGLLVRSIKVQKRTSGESSERFLPFIDPYQQPQQFEEHCALCDGVMQIIAARPQWKISAPTLVGEDPMETTFGDEDAMIYGRRVQSRLYLKPLSESPDDFSETTNMTGDYGGLYTPMRRLVVSKKTYQVLRQFKLNYIDLEPIE